MELPVEIVELILVNASFQDACKAKMISRQWRDASIDLLRRGTYKRKTLEERVEFLQFKIRKEAKRSGKKDKLLKDDLNRLLAYALNMPIDLPAIVGSRKLSEALVRIWLYAEDEPGLWDYFDGIIAKSDKIHIRSALIAPYFIIRCQELYELNLDLVDEAIDKHANLNLEVDPTKGGRPENAENLIKVFKHYFDALIPALGKMNKELIAWLQHIYKTEKDFSTIKAIFILHFITPSILGQSSDRDVHKSTSKKPKPEPIVRVRKYILICKILSSAMLGNNHKEEFLRGADAYTAQVATQLNDAIRGLLAVNIDTSTLFQPIGFSVREILDALSVVKEKESKNEKPNNNNNK